MDDNIKAPRDIGRADNRNIFGSFDGTARAGKQLRVNEMTGDIDDYNFSTIEKMYQSFLVKRAKEGYREYKIGFSVSIPKSLKTGFLESCFYNGVDYHEIIEAYMQSYVGQNGIDISLKIGRAHV